VRVCLFDARVHVRVDGRYTRLRGGAFGME
jgi:hypothetical protein